MYRHAHQENHETPVQLVTQPGLKMWTSRTQARPSRLTPRLQKKRLADEHFIDNEGFSELRAVS